MANPLSTVGELVEEVATLLNRDNIDSRIMVWISMVYNDLAQRAASELFYNYTVVAVTGEEVEVTSFGNSLTIPVALIYKTGTHLIYTPQYVTFQDYGRIAKSTEGVATTTGAYPRYWTIRQEALDNEGVSDNAHVYLWPAPSSGTIHLVTMGQTITTPKASGDYLFLPYHFEHVVVWGAYAYGCKAIRPECYQAAVAEYEQALDNMLKIMGYRVDSTPVLRHSFGRYAGTSKMQSWPRFPTSITGS